MSLLPFAGPPYNPAKDTIHVLKAGDTMTGDLNTQNLLPTTTNTYNLGSSGEYYLSAFIGTVNLNSTSFIQDSSGTLHLQSGSMSSSVTIKNGTNAGALTIPSTTIGPASTVVPASNFLVQHVVTGASGQNVHSNFAPVINQSGTAGYTVLMVNPTSVLTGSGSKLLADFQIGSTSKLSIDITGTITHADGGNIVVGSTNGTKIGTASTQKLGFYGVTPVVKPANIPASAGTVGANTTAINAVLTLLQSLGLMT